MDKLTENEYQENGYQENTTQSNMFDFITKGVNIFLSSTVVYDLYNKKISITYQNHTYTYDYT